MVMTFNYSETEGQIKMPTKLTSEIIAAAIEGFEVQKRRIDERISELRAGLSGGPARAAAAPEAPARRRKRFSAAARRRMKEAQQRRWARIRGESAPPPATPGPAKPARRISEEGMKRIIAATKKRWRLQKAAAGAPAKKAAPKKAAAKKTAMKAAPAKAAQKPPSDQMKGYPPRSLFFAPVLEIRGDAKWGVTGDKLKD